MNGLTKCLIGGILALMVIVISTYQDSFFDNNWITKLRKRLKQKEKEK